MKCFIIFTLILSGCSAVGNIQSVGGDTHSVTSSGRLTPWVGLKASSVQKAREFCATENRQMVVVGWETRGARGWHTQEGELTFNCIAQLPDNKIQYNHPIKRTE